MMFFRAITPMLLLLLLLFACLAGDVAARPQLVAVQVAHRHGSRTPFVSSKYTDQVCGHRGCGALNKEGEEMLVQLGKQLRERYGPGGATPLPQWPSWGYDPNYFYSRSTDVNRCLQSADGLIKGLFPSETRYFPVVHTVPAATDTLLRVNAIPAFYIPYMDGQRPPAWALVGRTCVEELGGVANITHIGADILGLRDICTLTNVSDNAAIGLCVLNLEDVAASFASTGEINDEKYAPLVKHYETLSAMRKLANSRYYPYNTSSDDDKKRGSLGYSLATQMLNNMLAFSKEELTFAATASTTAATDMGQTTADELEGIPAGSTPPSTAAEAFPFFPHESAMTAPPTTTTSVGNISGDTPLRTRIFEYSAHDTTMMPLCATLGHNDDMLPLFGQMYLFETYIDDVAGGALTVRAFYGSPTQTPGGHRYDIQPLSIPCIDANNARRHKADDNECLVADFKRGIDATRAQSPLGDCYLPAQTLAQIGCDKHAAPAKGSLCELYRTRCPEDACPEASVIDSRLATLQGGPATECIRISTTIEQMHDNSVVIIGISAAVIGAILGSIVTMFVLRALARKRDGGTASAYEALQ